MENSTLFHNEIETYRLVVSGAGPVAHPTLGSIATKGVLPLPRLLTGTISTFAADASVGKMVLGVGTSFLDGGIDKLAQIEEGDFIWAPAQYVARRVEKVLSPTSLKLYAKFPSNLVGVALYKIPRTFHKIYAKSSGTAAAILLEQAFAVGDTFLNSGAPVTYDAQAASAEISFELSL